MKNKIKARNEEDWVEVYMKCTLKWYRLAKYGHRGGEICKVRSRDRRV